MWKPNSKPQPIPESGVRRFFYILSESFGKLVLINLLCCLCSIPIVTAPAAYAAALQLIRRITQDKHVEVISDYRTGFRENFRQATVFGLPHLLLTALLCYLEYVYIANIGVTKWLWIPTAVTPLLLVLLTVMGYYAFLAIVSVELPLRAILANSWRMTVGRLMKNILVFLLSTALLLIGVLLLPTGVVYLLLLAIALQAYCIAWILYPDVIRNMAASQS